MSFSAKLRPGNSVQHHLSFTVKKLLVAKQRTTLSKLYGANYHPTINNTQIQNQFTHECPGQPE